VGALSFHKHGQSGLRRYPVWDNVPSDGSESTVEQVTMLELSDEKQGEERDAED